MLLHFCRTSAIPRLTRPDVRSPGAVAHRLAEYYPPKPARQGPHPPRRCVSQFIYSDLKTYSDSFQGIDNSLAFPHLHPLGWRTYAYGWLYLPVSCIGQPFTRKTRDHYLPLLSSPAWWAQTTMELRELFRSALHPRPFFK